MELVFVVFVIVFFFKQKTAYEMLRSLVGSEMCIRDRICADDRDGRTRGMLSMNPPPVMWTTPLISKPRSTCLLYTSDAADDLLCVDLGGRRIIKKNKQLLLLEEHRPPNETTNPSHI